MRLPLEVFDLVREVECLWVEGELFLHEFLESIETSSQQVLFA